MAPNPPQPDFDYEKKPKGSNWTLQYCRSAYPKSRRTMISNLWAAATDIVVSNRLVPGFFPPGEKSLSDARADHANTFLKSFELDLAVEGFDEFPWRLCRGILTYVGTHLSQDASNKVKQGQTPQTDRSQSISVSQPAVTVPQPAVINLFTDPPPDWDLSEFRFFCQPFHPNVLNYRTVILGEAIIDWSEGISIEYINFKYDLLRQRLHEKGLIDSNDTARVLTYICYDQRVGIVTDDDLHLALRAYLTQGGKQMTISILTQDDIEEERGVVAGNAVNLTQLPDLHLGEQVSNLSLQHRSNVGSEGGVGSTKCFSPNNDRDLL